MYASIAMELLIKTRFHDNKYIHNSWSAWKLFKVNNGTFFLDFQIYLQSVYVHSNTISKLCVEKRGRVEECSVAPLCDKRVKTLCGCRGKKGTN
jgi:hypothetical protein